ncbi:prostacyclin synthase [Colletotrichum plurivorum]|uniref:Prostacyclin synthase n=1 Tax=Colletotrichum plurivorum TaxID=2175906 RepID=A0A8H6J2B1_9PEZI|nr:prostacyclin synthase [Colletotrichum plurivorum]
MPKWVFNSPAGLLSDTEKKQIAEGMTKVYTFAKLPAFYCHAHFCEFAPGNIYTAGEPSGDVCTIAIYHIAKVFETPEVEAAFIRAFDDVVRPILKPKGIDWESGIYESRRELWRVNGLEPPLRNSEMERKWFEAGKATDEEELLKQQLGK